MAIEFRCPQCQKLLRVGDDAAGKQAKCPGCGTPVTVPSATAPPLPPPGSPFDAGAGDPFGGLPPVPPPASDNPYAAPLSSGPSVQRGPAPPAWERDGASISSMIATVKEVFSSPSEFFATMRQEGGISQPLLFYFILSMIAATIGAITQFGLQGAMMGVLPQQPGNAGPPWQAMVGGGVVGLVFGIMFTAVVLPIYSFVVSGIFHLMLMLFGGANRPFETSFRVFCYAYGATAVIGMVPICGSSIQGIVALVFTGIGLCYAHNTDGWRATLAILAPLLCCGGLLAAIVIALIGGIAAAAGGAGGPNPGPGMQPQPFNVNEFKIEEHWRLSPQAIVPTSGESFDPFAALPSTPRSFGFAQGFAPHK